MKSDIMGKVALTESALEMMWRCIRDVRGLLPHGFRRVPSSQQGDFICFRLTQDRVLFYFEALGVADLITIKSMLQNYIHIVVCEVTTLSFLVMALYCKYRLSPWKVYSIFGMLSCGCKLV